MLSIVLLLSISIKDFSFAKLFPIFGYGKKELFITQSLNLYAFNIIAYLYFLPPFLKDRKDFKRISILSIFLCGLYFMLSIIALTMSFAFAFKADESLSLYMLARSITLGHFIERIDAIFIFIWILSFFSFISFNMFLVSAILKKGLKLEESKELIYTLSGIFIGFALIFKNMSITNIFARDFCKKYMVIVVFVVSFIIALLALLKDKLKHRLKKA